MAFTYVITGAHGTGKTTLISALKETLSDQYNFSVSSTRASGANLNHKATDEDQLKILDAINQYEVNNGLYEHDYILDRSFIDFLAYSRYLHDIGEITSKTVSLIEEEFKKRIDKYTLVFYLPIEFDVEADDVRITSKTYQTAIDDHIKNILSEFNISFLPVHGSVKARANFITRHIPVIIDSYDATEILHFAHINDGDEYICKYNLAYVINKKAVSFISYDINDRIKIGYIYTNPDHRKLGLASKLLDRLLAMYKNHIFYMYIKFDALPFYQRYGLDKFIIGESIFTGAQPNYYATFFNGDTLTAIELDDFTSLRVK